MNIAITGADGFIAKNLIFNLKFLKDCNIFEIRRSTSKKKINLIIKKSDLIYHMAAVNRPTKKKLLRKTMKI